MAISARGALKRAVPLALLPALAATVSAAADAVSDFYKNGTITLYAGFGPGGGYDLYARPA